MTAGRNFAVFVAIGGFSSLVNLVARILFNRYTDYGTAVVLAFPVALLTAFCLNRALVFQSESAGWHGQLLRFLIVNLVALVLVYAISLSFAQVVFPATGMDYHPELFAHALGLLSPLFLSYWAHKRFTFKGQ